MLPYVDSLIREIALPPELQVSEGYGEVSWGVRSILEGYIGWFRMASATEIYPNLVSAAGGHDAVTKLSRQKLEARRPVEALHLSEMALAAAPNDEPALRATLAAYEKLLELSREENHYEVFWLRELISETRAELGIPQ